MGCAAETILSLVTPCPLQGHKLPLKTKAHFLLDPDRLSSRCPKVYLGWKDTRGSEMLPAPITYCFYRCRGLCLHTWVVTTFAIMMASAPLQASTAPKTSACGYLAGLIDKAPPSGPLFLPSYPTVESGPLHGAAYLYDNAVAAIALVGCGEQDKAYRIGSAILWAIDNDRTWHDGRLRNAYAAGVVANGPVKLPGWWDNTQNKWLEDRYQVGSDVGNMAWAMLALLSIDDVNTGSRFRDGAARLGAWVAQWADTRGTGGFTGGTFGHEPTPEVRTWKSTEHNTDLAAAFGLLAIRTGDSRWRDKATVAEYFVNTMWDPACACFAAGTAEDGVTHNPILALDAQVWPLMALLGAAEKFSHLLSDRPRVGHLPGVRSPVSRRAVYDFPAGGRNRIGNSLAELFLDLAGAWLTARREGGG